VIGIDIVNGESGRKVFYLQIAVPAYATHLNPKGGERMKKLISAVLVVMFALSLSACAGMQKGEKTRVKCPACGYEFDAPAKN